MLMVSLSFEIDVLDLLPNFRIMPRIGRKGEGMLVTRLQAWEAGNDQYAETRTYLLGISKMKIAYLPKISMLATLSLILKQLFIECL